MKKWIALILALMMAMVLTACGEPEPTEPPTEPPMTARQLIQELNAASADKQVTAATTEIELSLSVSSGDAAMEMGMNLTMEQKSSAEPYASYGEITMTMDIAGEQTVETYQQYLQEEDGSIVSYSHTDSTNKWEKLDMGVLTDELKDQAMNYDMLEALADEQVMLDENSKTVDGREVYVLQCTFTGEQTQEAMDSFSGLEDLLAVADMGEIDFSALTMPATYYIDAETMLPVRMEIEIQGMDEMMAGLLAASLGADGAEVEIEIPVFRAVYSGIGYEPVEVPVVPDEGRIKASQYSFNPDQGDGTYIIQESGSAVKITCPEGWTATEMSYDSLTLTRDDGKQSVTYTMWTGIAGGYGFVSKIERGDIVELMGDGNYGSHGNSTFDFGDKSYGSVWVKCNDGSRIHYVYDQIGAETNYMLVKMTDKTGKKLEDAMPTVLEIVEEYQLLP